MYFWGEWDAQKSVKYVLAARVNHNRALRSRAGAGLELIFRFYLKGLEN